jgi:hypothetical protein
MGAAENTDVTLRIGNVDGITVPIAKKSGLSVLSHPMGRNAFGNERACAQSTHTSEEGSSPSLSLMSQGLNAFSTTATRRARVLMQGSFAPTTILQLTARAKPTQD